MVAAQGCSKKNVDIAIIRLASSRGYHNRLDDNAFRTMSTQTQAIMTS